MKTTALLLVSTFLSSAFLQLKTANAQDFERMKDVTHTLRKDELRNVIQRQPFQVDVIRNEEKSTGMAFFFKDDGTALTSYHVVKDGQSLMAGIDGMLYTVEIIGFDEVLDVAVIRVKNFQSNPFQISQVTKGELALGGKVSIFEKKAYTYGKVIQNSGNIFMSDINITQGFSGSPVFCGEAVCGIVTSFEKKTNHAIAVKSSRVMKNLEKMLAGEALKKKKFNFYVMDLQKYDAISLDDSNTNTTSNVTSNPGVLITYSDDELLQTWDIVTQINGQNVAQVEDLQVIISNIYASEPVSFMVIRGREKMNIIMP